MPRLRSAAVAAAFTLGLAACDDDGATTQLGYEGREIVVTGGSNHSVTSRPSGQAITVDGLQIVITDQLISVGGAPQELEDWQRLEVVVDDGTATITVDGTPLN